MTAVQHQYYDRHVYAVAVQPGEHAPEQLAPAVPLLKLYALAGVGVEIALKHAAQLAQPQHGGVLP